MGYLTISEIRDRATTSAARSHQRRTRDASRRSNGRLRAVLLASFALGAMIACYVVIHGDVSGALTLSAVALMAPIAAVGQIP